MNTPIDNQGNPAEPILLTCSKCAKKLRVNSMSAGSKVLCPACGTVQVIPAAPAPVVPAPPIQPVVPSASLNPGSNLGEGFLAEPVSHGNIDQPVTAEPMIEGPAFADQGAVDNGPREPSALHLGSHKESLTEGAGATPTKDLFDRINTQLRKIFVGQDELVLGTLTALFSAGHVLIESVPGLGKTLFVRTLGQILGCEFGRIQFTADLMPSDITGAPIFDMKTQQFRFFPGPVFTQLLLADEINRSPAKTHAALLEIMQECRVTIDGKTHVIDRPFLVMATQNPIESEGTYNLPEAQLDRFMFKLIADYPCEAEEAEILKMHSRQVDINKRLVEEVQTVTSQEEILQITSSTSDIHIDDRLLDYINKIVRLTRTNPHLHMGASPRAGLALMQGSRTIAAFSGRDYATPDDVIQLVLPALRHRVILTAEAEVEGQSVDAVLTQMVRSVEVPRL